MTDTTFYNKIEKKLHIGIILFNAAFCTGAVSTKTINPTVQADVCHFSRKPWGCDRSSDCERGHYARIFSYVYTPIGTPVLCLIGIIVSMSIVWWNVISRERMFLSRTTGKTSLRRIADRMKAFLARKESPQREWNEQQPDETDVHFIARIYRRETMLQAFLYVSVFLATNGVGIYVTLSNVFDAEIPLFMLLIFLVFYPMSGMFNVLVYTRPAIIAFRRERPELSRFCALWLVVKAGGAKPDSVVVDSEQSVSSALCCCVRPSKDDNIVPRAASQEHADVEALQGEGCIASSTLIKDDGNGIVSSWEIQSMLQSNSSRHQLLLNGKSSLVGKQVVESSNLSSSESLRIEESKNVSSLTLDIACKSDVELGRIAPDAFQRAFARVKNRVKEEAPESEYQIDKSNNPNSLENESRLVYSYNDLSGFSGFQDGEDTYADNDHGDDEEIQGENTSTPSYHSSTNVKDASSPNKVSYSSNDLSGFSGFQDCEDTNNGNDHGNGVKTQRENTSKPAHHPPAIDTDASSAREVASVGIATQTFSRANIIEGGKHEYEDGSERGISYASLRGLSGYSAFKDGGDIGGCDDGEARDKISKPASPVRSTDLAPVGIAAHAFQRALARANNVEGEKNDREDRGETGMSYSYLSDLSVFPPLQDGEDDSYDDDDDTDESDDEEEISYHSSARLPDAASAGKVAPTGIAVDNHDEESGMKVNNVSVAHAFKKAFARAATRRVEIQEEDNSRDMPLSSMNNFTSKLPTLMEVDGDEEDEDTGSASARLKN